MSDTRNCAECGAPLPSYWPKGLCTQCALDGALDMSHGASGVLQAEAPAAAAGLQPPPSNGERAPLGTFGDYDLLEEIARGGMGVVYKARHRSLNRIVAVKMILAGSLAGREFVQRFRTEASAAAIMQHQNIVAIHDVGVYQGQHYFSMDYVEGRTLAQLTGQKPLSANKAARYVELIAEAIHYAHEHGILHRDLKPSNVLIDDYDQPRITDFGLARRLDGESSLTLSGQVLGSPNFMPPEQAGTNRGMVGRPSDVYALGGILYYLLTARAPFQADSLEHTISQVLNAEPVSPRLLNPSIPRDLETITLKCLEKEPSRRYQTAKELADELGRVLRHEPIQARAVNAPEKLWRWCRRKPALAGAVGFAVAALVVGTGVSIWQANVAVRARALAEKNFNQATAAESQLRDALTATSTARNRAELNAETARQNLYAADMNLVHRALQEGDLGQARQLLGPHEGQDSDLCGFEYQLFREQARGDQFDSFDFGSIVTSVVFVPHKERQWVAATWDGRIAVHDLDAHRSPVYLTARSETAILMHQLAFSPDRSILASAGKDGIELWNTGNWNRRDISNAPALLGRGLSSICFSPDGSFLAARRGGLVCLWNTSDWSIADQVDCGAAKNGRVLIFIDNRRLAVSAQKQVQVWQIDGTNRQLSCAWKSAGFSSEPGGGLLAHGGYLAAISGPIHPGNVVEFKVWNLETFELAASRDGAHQNFAFDLCISPDGTRILSAGGDQLIKVWTFPKLELVDTLLGHGNEVWALAFSPDGKALASGGKDGAVRLWQFDRLSAPPPMAQPPAASRMSEDGTHFLVTEGAGTFAIRDAASGSLSARFESEGQPLAFPSATNLIVWKWDRADERLVVEHIDPRTGDRLGSRKYDAIQKLTTQKIVGSGDGRRLVVNRTEGYEFWETHSGRRTQILLDPDGGSIRVVSSSGDYLVSEKRTGASEGILKIWHITDLKPRKVIPHKFLGDQGLLFSPREDVLAATDWAKNAVVLWNLRDGEIRSELVGHTSSIEQIAFSPDGRTLISRNRSDTRLWQVATAREIVRVARGVKPLSPRLSMEDRVLGPGFSGNVEFWRLPEKKQERVKPPEAR